MSLSVFLLWSVSVQASDWRYRLWHGRHRNGWPTYDDANTLLDEWLQRYPDYLRRETIGKSYQNRDMVAYILTDNSTSTKNQLLMTSLLHGREPAGLGALMYYMGSVLENATANDPEALYTLRRKQIYAIPFLNPDAYIENESGDGMVRKNRRPTCPRNEHKGGVDLNRNFGFHFKKEFGGCDEEYQGAGPFSEPETLALKSLVNRTQFTTAYHYHSYGEMLTHPYNYINGPVTNEMPADDKLIYAEIGRVFKYKLFGTAYEVMQYHANGESDDWFYGAEHIISMSPELGPEKEEFWPHSRVINGINVRSFPRTSYVVYKSGCEPDVTLEVGSVKVKNAGLSSCPAQRIAFADAIVSVPELARRSSVSLPHHEEEASAFCLQEDGLALCVCDTRGPGTGTWADRNSNALCERLVTSDPSIRLVDTTTSKTIETPKPPVKPTLPTKTPVMQSSSVVVLSFLVFAVLCLCNISRWMKNRRLYVQAEVSDEIIEDDAFGLP